MKYLRYYAEFYDRHDRKYRVEIHQEASSAYAPVEVELAANPVTIEWNEVEKLDPVRGSGATLRLISMSDRQFYDMYSVDYGIIELNVMLWENGAWSMYWAGTLDPELFAEPYAYADRYVTELTFVDLAVLDYANFDGEGRLSIAAIIDKCIASSRIDNINVSVNDSMISTKAATSNGDINIRECVISSDNFYDEDDEPMTMREVLEEVLRPFGLQLTQRNGAFYLYDCHALSSMTPTQIEWYSNDSTLEADRIYNNVRVKFSPADIQEVADTEIDHEDILQGSGISRTMFGIVKGETEQTDWFTLHFGYYGTHGKLNVPYSNGAGATFFRIEPIYSGSDEAGILWGASFPDASGEATWAPHEPFPLLSSANPVWPASPCVPIFELEQFYTKSQSDSTSAQILVSLDFLYEARSNPFEDASLYSNPNDSTDFDDLKEYGSYIYVPMSITLWSDDGECLYRYSNNYRRLPGAAGNDSEVGWVATNSASERLTRPAWFCYYDGELGGKSGMNGWTTNKRIVGRKINGAPILTEQQKRRNEGEYIDLPPIAGHIKIEVFSGVMIHKGDHEPIYRDGVTTSYNATYQRYHGWVAYKNLNVRYVPKYGPSDDYDKVDFEESGYINKLAREVLAIDTIVGSSGDTLMAKGDICDTSGSRITSFSRGGYTDRLERLLIGTAYSQYASRKNILSGTIEAPTAFGVLSDEAISGKYMVVSEVLNVEESTSEIKAIEVSADQYESIEEVEE